MSPTPNWLLLLSGSWQCLAWCFDYFSIRVLHERYTHTHAQTHTNVPHPGWISIDASPFRKCQDDYFVDLMKKQNWNFVIVMFEIEWRYDKKLRLYYWFSFGIVKLFFNQSIIGMSNGSHDISSVSMETNSDWNNQMHSKMMENVQFKSIFWRFLTKLLNTEHC